MKEHGKIWVLLCAFSFLFIPFFFSSCENPSAPKNFEVKTAFYNDSDGMLTVYTNVRDGVEFKLNILNHTLTSTTSSNGKLIFDCLLVLAKERVPSGIQFSVYLTAPGYSSVYTNTYTHVNAAASNTTADSDGDGISDWYEMYRYGTDPYSEDTDGDSWSDFEELSMYDPLRKIFDPRIADLPQMDVEISEDFSIGYKYTTGSSSTEQTTESKSQGFTHTNTDSYTNTATSSLTNGWSASVTPSYQFSGTNQGWALSATFGYNGHYTSGSTYSMTKSLAESSSTTYSEGKAYTKGETRNVSGGLVKTKVTVKNTSNIAYTLTHLTLNLNKIRFSDENYTSVAPLSSYTYDSQITLSPGESRDINIAFDLGVGAFESIVNDKTCLNVAVSGYTYEFNKLNQRLPLDFTEATTKVKAKCAFVRIDYGPELLSTGKVQPEERYWISTKCSFNPNATNLDTLYNTISIHEALTEIVGFTDDNLILDDTGKIKTIKSKTSKASHKEGDWYILKHQVINNVESEEMYNDYLVKDRESESVMHTGNPSYDLKELPLDAGASYLIFYDIDNDEDYLPLNTERQYGSDDTKVDTDGDNIEDFYEVHGWHRDAAPEKVFYTNPVNTDTDGDTYNDYEDEEPCIPAKSNDTTVSECIITNVYDTAHPYNLTETVKAIQRGTSSVITECDVYDKVTLSVRTAIVYNKISYLCTTQNIAPNNTAALNALTGWKELNHTELFTPPVEPRDGGIYLWVKIVSYDNTKTDYILVAQLHSHFCPLSNFSATPATVGSDPSVVVTFDRYTDIRADATDGGYILWGKPVANAAKTTLSRAEVQGAQETVSEAVTKTSPAEFFLKVKDLTSAVTLKPFSQNQDWTFKLFAYSGNGSADTFRCEELGSKSITTILLDTGKLVFYPVYVEAVVDRDGGSSPEYYWTFTSDVTNSGSSSFDFRNMNIGRDSAKELEETGKNGNKFWVFDASGGHKTRGEPAPEWNAKTEVTLSRTQDHVVKIFMEVMEKDSVTADDYIGKITMTLTYDKATDTWSYMDGQTKVILSTGSGKKVWTFPLESSDGDIKVRCDFEWTYTTE